MSENIAKVVGAAKRGPKPKVKEAAWFYAVTLKT
jgi:hypothetical protein